MSGVSIRVTNLKKVFRKRSTIFGRKATEEWALKGVNFEVRTGESYALLGPNGSGKSTLLLPDEGTVEIEGLRLPEDERRIREIIGRVSVDAAFYKKLSAKENLLYSAFMYGYRRAAAEDRAKEILDQLGFPARRFGDPLEEMSRGMQQKIAITRALLLNPPVLLLDEPTTGLDPKSKRDVQVFLERLREMHRTTILLTSHDMSEAERLCERIGLLADGRLVAEGTADQLRHQAGATNLDDVFIELTGKKLVDEEKEQVEEV